MVKIFEFSMFLITFVSLPSAEAATPFTCDGKICEFNGVNEMDKAWTSTILSRSLKDVVNRMVEDDKRNVLYDKRPVAWKNFTDVSFKNSHFEEIPSILFETLSGLIKFEAVDVQLKDVDWDTFKFASSLQHIDLSKNRISYLPNKLLSQLSKLISVNLSHNAISIIHDSAFESTSLSLILLDLGFNKLKEFKDDFMVQLSEKRVNLKVNLESNQLHEFGGVYRRQVNQWYPQHQQIHVIQHVNIKNNQISTLRFLLTKTLEADNNQLKEFTVDEHMVNVSLKNNEISSMNFLVDASVERLVLSGNKLNRAIVDKMKNLGTLTHLDLSENSLLPLEIGTFAKMTSLEELNLAAIGMESISFGLFSHQQNLKLLNISHNNLASIDQHMLISLENLITLDISGNKLTRLADFERYRDTFPKLMTIAVDGNFWSCKYLAKLVMAFKSLKIDIAKPINSVISESSVMKIGCSSIANDISMAAIQQFDSFDEVSEAIANLTNQINEFKELFGEHHAFVYSMSVSLVVSISIGFIIGFIYLIRNFIRNNKLKVTRNNDNLRPQSMNTFEDSLI